MRKLLARSATLLLITLSVWPVFVVIGLAYSYLGGEGSVLNTWYLEPKRKLLAHFIDGVIYSAPIAAGMAIIALLCGMASERLKWVRLLPLLLLPAIGVAIAQIVFYGNVATLICLALTGFIVAIKSLVLTRIMRNMNR